MDFSGGEVREWRDLRFPGTDPKGNEIFHMAVLEPRLAILDETDSGLDIDALRTVSEGVALWIPGEAKRFVPPVIPTEGAGRHPPTRNKEGTTDYTD